MNTNVIEKSKWERDLEVEVPAERIDREMTSAMRRYQKRLEIPGFRKGKVPIKVIEKRFGPSIRHGVIEDLLPTLIHEASEQTGLVPAGSPRITALDQVEDGGLTFTASIDIWPEVELQGEDALELERLEHEVTDAEIDEQIEEVRTRLPDLQMVPFKYEEAVSHEELMETARGRLEKGGYPLLVANRGDESREAGSQVAWLIRSGEEPLRMEGKSEIASALLDRIESLS